MKFDLISYNKMLQDNNISIIYSGPMRAKGLDSFSETLQSRLDLSDLPLSASQSVFSVFVEQINNMMMYSAERELSSPGKTGNGENLRDIFIFGVRGDTYFVQSGNLMKDSRVRMLKERLDYLNTLDKKELRQFYKEQIKAENLNPDSKGAGIGLIEIARRATSKIDYEFIPLSGGLAYFIMYVTILAEKRGE